MNNKYPLPLPVGGKLIKPITKVVGSWVNMTYDAKVERCGVVWLRVKEGMGGRNDREDWVADIPNSCISVHDYHWNGEEFGANHGTFDNACLQELKEGLQTARTRMEEAEKTLAGYKNAIAILEKIS